MRTILFIAGFMILFIFPVRAQKKESKYIREGNREFEKENFDDSEVRYRKALEESKTPYRSSFNIADALYKQEKYGEAVDQFEDISGLAPDKYAKSWTYHNLGNALLQNQKIEESIEAYKEALRNNPGDMETKYNLAYAQNLLKNQQKQNQDQNQDQDQQNQDQQNKDDQNQQKDQNQDQQNDQNQDQQNNQQQQQPQPNELSKEDAQRILQALQNQENEVQDKVKKAKAAKARVKTKINW